MKLAWDLPKNVCKPKAPVWTHFKCANTPDISQNFSHRCIHTYLFHTMTNHDQNIFPVLNDVELLFYFFVFVFQSTKHKLCQQNSILNLKPISINYYYHYKKKQYRKYLSISHTPILDQMKRYKTLYKSHLTFWVNFSYKKCDLYSNIYGNDRSGSKFDLS